MPKHRAFDLKDGLREGLKEFPKVETVTVAVKPLSETQKLRLCVDAIYKVKGRSSGQEYVFHGAGSAQDVLKEDVEFLLNLRQGKGCCGGGGGSAVFELAGE